MNEATKVLAAIVGLLVVVALLNFGSLNLGGGPKGTKVYGSFR